MRGACSSSSSNGYSATPQLSKGGNHSAMPGEPCAVGLNCFTLVTVCFNRDFSKPLMPPNNACLLLLSIETLQRKRGTASVKEGTGEEEEKQATLHGSHRAPATLPTCTGTSTSGRTPRSCRFHTHIQTSTSHSVLKHRSCNAHNSV